MNGVRLRVTQVASASFFLGKTTEVISGIEIDLNLEFYRQNLLFI